MIKKYYAYFVPRTMGKGIAESWKECEKFVKGEANARFKGFKTRIEAEKWLDSGADYDLKNLESGIYFDAGTGRGNGVEASVVNEKGESLLHEILPKKDVNEFHKHNLKEGLTNNYGELLACKFALEIALKNGAKKIFGDSKLVINYWSKGYVKEENVDEESLNLIDEVKLLRDKFENNGGTLVYIEGRDNPAYLGFHR